MVLKSTNFGFQTMFTSSHYCLHLVIIFNQIYAQHMLMLTVCSIVKYNDFAFATLNVVAFSFCCTSAPKFLHDFEPPKPDHIRMWFIYKWNCCIKFSIINSSHALLLLCSLRFALCGNLVITQNNHIIWLQLKIGWATKEQLNIIKIRNILYAFLLHYVMMLLDEFSIFFLQRWSHRTLL